MTLSVMFRSTPTLVALTALVAPLLTRALRAQEATEAKITAKPGDGLKVTAGDAFSLSLLTWIQPGFRFLANDQDNPASNGGSADTASFRIKHARTRLAGNLYEKDLEYRLITEWVEGTPVKDAWLRWTLWRNDSDAIGLRFGQQKTFYGRESTASDFMLDFVDRALATNTFSNGRSRGVTLMGSHGDGKVHWTAGTYNSDSAAASASSGEEAANPDNELDYVLTARLDPAGDMGDEAYSEGDLEHLKEILWSVGAGLQIGNHRSVVGASTVDVDGRDFNLNAAMKLAGIHALGEVFFRSDDPDLPSSSAADSFGWQLGATYTLARQENRAGQWAFGGRYSAIHSKDAGQPVLSGSPLGSAKGDLSELSVLAGYYHRAHKLKVQGSWTLQEVSPSGSTHATNHLLELQVQFLF